MIKINGIEIINGGFPNGETYIDIPNEVILNCDKYVIDFKFESNQDIWNLIQIVDNLNQDKKEKHLRMAYCPYSRMDRKENNRLFALKTFANLINDMGFNSVTIAEPHSDVTPALFNNVVVKDVSKQMVKEALTDLNIRSDNLSMEISKVCLVWPDAGADKRYHKQFDYSHSITVGKVRDFDTGYLVPKYIFGSEKEQSCEIAIIVDDICSGGRTFIMAAEKLREKLPNLKKVILCVTHCENTIASGNIFNTDLIDDVYTTDSVIDTEKVQHKKLHVFNCENYM